MTPPKSSPGAIWSLVLGILSVVSCLGPVTGIPAVVCGHVSRGNIRRSQGTLTGDGMARAGLILGYAGTVLSILAILAFALFVTMNRGMRFELEEATMELGRESEAWETVPDPGPWEDLEAPEPRESP